MTPGDQTLRQLCTMIVAILFLFGCAAPLCAAEEKPPTQRFEEELSKPDEKPHDERHHREEGHHHDHHRHHDDVSAGEVATEGLIELFAQFFLAGLFTSVDESPGDMYRRLKENESPALPTIRVEPSYQYLIGGQHGVSAKAEAGWLVFGANGEYLRYFADSPASDLSIASGHFLLRSLFAEVIGIDLALGVKSLWGQERHTGFELGLPLHFFFGKHVILDVAPYWASIRGRDVYDLDSGLSFKWKFVGVRAGYRAMFTGGETLHGPKVGVFLQW